MSEDDIVYFPLNVRCGECREVGQAKYHNITEMYLCPNCHPWWGGYSEDILSLAEEE